MTENIPDHDKSLYMGETTTADDIASFLTRRLTSPATVNGAVVFNFNVHAIDARALVNADLGDGIYTVPYQASGAWGFMQEILPRRIADAPILVYRPADEEYSVHENFRSLVDDRTKADLNHHLEMMAESTLREVRDDG